MLFEYQKKFEQYVNIVLKVRLMMELVVMSRQIAIRDKTCHDDTRTPVVYCTKYLLYGSKVMKPRKTKYCNTKMYSECYIVSGHKVY